MTKNGYYILLTVVDINRGYKPLIGHFSSNPIVRHTNDKTNTVYCLTNNPCMFFQRA